MAAQFYRRTNQCARVCRPNKSHFHIPSTQRAERPMRFRSGNRNRSGWDYLPPEHISLSPSLVWCESHDCLDRGWSKNQGGPISNSFILSHSRFAARTQPKKTYRGCMYCNRGTRCQAGDPGSVFSWLGPFGARYLPKGMGKRREERKEEKRGKTSAVNRHPLTLHSILVKTQYRRHRSLGSFLPWEGIPYDAGGGGGGGYIHIRVNKGKKRRRGKRKARRRLLYR